MIKNSDLSKNYLIDYSNVDAGIGHSLGLFNSFVKIAIQNDLTIAYSKKQLKKTSKNDLSFLLKTILKPLIGKGIAETHNIGDGIDSFFRMGDGEISREYIEEKIKKNKLKIIPLPSPINPEQSISDEHKYSEINTIIKKYKNEQNIVFALPENRRDGDCEYKLTRDWFLTKYKNARKADPIKSYFNTSKINIAVHIRRGDLLPNRSFSHLSSRMLPDYWYAELINQLHELIGDKIIIHIYSEGKSKQYINENGQPNDWATYKKIKSGIPFFLHIDEPWYIDFNHMVNADILITAKSGFSHLAGMLNENGIKITPPMWHSYEGASNIISVDEKNAEFNVEEFMLLFNKLFNNF